MKRALSTKLKEGTVFPAHINFSVISTRKLATYKDNSNDVANRQLPETVKLSIEDLAQLYSDKEQIVLFYQFPQPRFTAYDMDPFAQTKAVRSHYSKQSTLFLGISH